MVGAATRTASAVDEAPEAAEGEVEVEVAATRSSSRITRWQSSPTTI